jgi:uncharacterized phage protein gp47/JayE
MAQNVEVVYKDRETILSEVLARWQARISDIATGQDTITRIWSEVFSDTAEGLMLAMQLLHDDIFVQTMSALALVRAGEQYGRPQKAGLLAVGSVRITGTGGTFVGTDTIVGAPRTNLDDTLLFNLTQSGTIPNPGIPTAPTTADGGAGTLAAGTYEHAVSFVTAAGETEIGASSTALVLAGSRQISITNIPLGGTGTIGRNVYRRLNGGTWNLVTTLANNTATTYTQNAVAGSQTPVADSTAEAITLTAQSDETGAEYNVAPGTITEITDGATIGNLSTVTNGAAFTGATDPEDIEVFRSALLDWVRSPASGGPGDLKVWAEAVDGVESATVFENMDLAGASAPGTATVRISGPEGSVPPSDVVTAVSDALNARDLAVITILVGTFTPNPVNVTAVITPATGYVLADLSAQITEAVQDYINGVPVGGTVYTAGVIDAIFGLPGVATVSVSAPAAPGATSTATQKPTLGTVTLT